MLLHVQRNPQTNVITNVNPWLARMMRLITAKPAVLYSRLMPSKIAVRNLGTNVNTCTAESADKC